MGVAHSDPCSILDKNFDLRFFMLQGVGQSISSKIVVHIITECLSYLLGYMQSPFIVRADYAPRFTASVLGVCCLDIGFRHMFSAL